MQIRGFCPPRPRRTRCRRAAPSRRSARLYNGMTQTNSANIVAIKPSMEYATLCMSMRLPTSAIRQIRTVQRSPGVPRPGLRPCVLPVVPAHDLIEGWRSGRSWVSHRSRTDAIAVAGLDDSSASGSGHERDGDAAPLPPETFVLAPGGSGTWPASKSWGAARPSGNAGPVSSGYDRWEHAGAIRSRCPCPAVSGGVDQSPNTRNSMTK
jgi:hypothetical protein